MNTEASTSEYERLSDEALMLRFRDGDVLAFDVLFSRYLLNTKKRVRFLAGSEELAEEVFQGAWEKIIKAKDRYETKATFKTYFYTVLVNLIRDHFRKSSNQAQLHISGDEAKDSESGESIFGGMRSATSRDGEERSFIDECINFLKEAINGLPLDQREPLLLQLDSDFTLEEIATIANVGRETIKSRLRYGLKKLRREVPEECYE